MDPIALEGHDQTAVVSPVGAALVSWTAGGAERLAHVTPGEPEHRFDGTVLAPWPNRIRDGAYFFAGRHHALPVGDDGSALHGLAWDEPWRVTDRNDVCVVLEHAVGGADGFPFAIVVQVTYRLAPSGLVAELLARNAGTEPAPFGCGAHPWLPAGELSVGAASVVPVDENLLPDGAPPQPVDPAVWDGPLDSCFGDLARDGGGIARARVGEVELWQDAAFPFVHVCTMNGRVAVEPVTCAPDAFNTGLGLLTLAHGERFAGRWGLTLTKETT